MKDMALTATKQGELHQIKAEDLFIEGHRKAIFRLWCFLHAVLFSENEVVFDEIPGLKVNERQE